MGHVHGVARAPRVLSAGTSLALSVLFVAVYGTTAWLTSLRGDVGTWSFDWERHLPLVRWLIVPYMSLDLFFVAAPFLCADRAELRAFRRRMTAAILAAGVVFLMMPLQFAFPRPEPAGWTGPIFGMLHAFDRPYNMFPSLHIAIWMILAGTYDRHTRGGVRMITHGWFGLIVVSTVLTYQHHVIDVAGGFALAVCCYYLIPEEDAPQEVTRHAGLGVRYATGAAILAGLGMGLWPWGLPLLWPAVSLTIVAGAYFGLYAGIARKRNGRLPIAATLILAPWLLGQQLSLFHYRRRCLPWNEVAPNVWIGRRLSDREAAMAVEHSVTAVLDLTGEFAEARPFLSVAYLNLQVLDLTAPTPAQLRAAVDFINAHRGTGTVYVHCKIGYSRSAAVVGAWLLDAGLAATAEQAIASIRAVRPTLVVRPEARAAVQDFARELKQDATPFEVRLNPGATAFQVRAKRDATAFEVRLKPDATAFQVRLNPDTTV
jgi:protein-tyrosine phosphatase/membrane-associated phospholipid phosphatase